MSWTPPVRSNEIYHGWLKRGAKASDHKYYQRIEDGVTKAGTPRYRYFYTKAEYDAYKMGSAQPQKQENGIKAKFDNAVNDVKKALSKKDNQYYVTKRNYEKKKEQIQETDEWKQITQDKNSEYRKKDKEGKVYYDYDQYLVDKKHPILDALSDSGHGRKIEIRKQSAETFVAGVRDYVKMAKDAVQAVAGISVGLLNFKIKNQQGSYEDEKKEFKEKASKVKDALETTTEVVNTLSKYVSKETSNKNTNDLANDMVDLAMTTIPKTVDKNGNVRAPSQEELNDIIDKASEVARKNARTQAERDKIDLATQKAKQYTNMSKEERANSIIDEATKLARSKATNQDELDMIDAASARAKKYSQMSEGEIKEDMINEMTDFVKSKTSTDAEKEIVDKLSERAKRYAQMSKEEIKQDIANEAETEVKKKVRDYIETNPHASAGIAAYAKERGLTYYEAQEELLNAPLSLIKKYAAKAWR